MIPEHTHTQTHARALYNERVGTTGGVVVRDTGWFDYCFSATFLYLLMKRSSLGSRKPLLRTDPVCACANAFVCELELNGVFFREATTYLPLLGAERNYEADFLSRLPVQHGEGFLTFEYRCISLERFVHLCPYTFRCLVTI